MRSVSAGGLVALAVLAGCVARPDLRGPLPVRNQHPAQLTVLHLDAASAAVLPAARTELRSSFTYSSLFLIGQAPTSSWVMDAEYLRAAGTARVGLGGGLELGAELALAHTTGGFLDDFIIDYHDVFGLPDQDRDTNPRDQFLVEGRRGGDVAWSVRRSDVELLDLPLWLTWQLAAPGTDRLGVAVRAGVELPTGDQERGYGNGEVDASAGVVLDYRTACVGWYAHAQHTFAGTPDPARRVGLAFQDVTSIGLGAELPLGRDLHALVQAEWETSTLRELGPRAAGREQLFLWFGGRWQPDPAWHVEVGFGEDLRGLVSPDFSAWLAVAWRP